MYLRCLKSHYKIDGAVEIQKIAVVDIEVIDKEFIQEINVFVLDLSKLSNSLQNEGKFLIYFLFKLWIERRVSIISRH